MDEYLDIIVTKSVTWYKSLSKEDRAKLDADEARPEAQKKAELLALWNRVDKNNDEHLQKIEFPSLFATYDQKKSTKGVPIETLTDKLR